MDSELLTLKKELISVSTDTGIGFNCTESTKQQIESLANKIEALTPNPEPTSCMELVQGRWRLLYSTFSLEKDTTLQRLSFGKLPDVQVKITGIFQEINLSGKQYNNLMEFISVSGVKGLVTVNSSYTIESVKRLNIKFIETSVCPLDKSLDMINFRKGLAVDNDCVLASPLEFSGWSDITYLDENLRLMRGNAQNLYVLVRDD